MDECRNNIENQDECNEKCKIELDKDYQPMSHACHCNYCEPIEQDCDFRNAIAIPILSQRIFDCVCLEDEQFKYDPCVTFYIEDGNFCNGDPICIDCVNVEYDFIGLTNKVLDGKIDAQNLKFYATNDSIYCCELKTHKDDDCECHELYLYDEFVGNVKESQIDCKSHNHGVKSRIFEENLNFYVCNFKISVCGKIGCKNFRASTIPYTGPLSDCYKHDCWSPGFKSVDLYGRVCIPKGAKKVAIHEEFKGCISVECVNTDDKYKRNKDCKSSFTAGVEYSLLVNKRIYTVIKDKLLVCSNNEDIICHPQSPGPSGCKPCCNLNRSSENDIEN